MKMMMNRPRRSPSTRPGRLPFQTKTDWRPKGRLLPLTLHSLQALLLRLARVDTLNVARQLRPARIHAVLAQLMPSALSAIVPVPLQVGPTSIAIQAMTSVATPWRPSTRESTSTTDTLNTDPARAGCKRFLVWNRLLSSSPCPSG